MNADEQAAENRRRRTFRKFTYRGVEVGRSSLHWREWTGTRDWREDANAGS
jgi:hypothetical protein